MTDACYFCGEPADIALDDHHIIPKRLVGNDADQSREVVDETVPICSNCHRKLHSLLDPAIEYVSERFKRRMDTPDETGFKPAGDLA